MIAPEDVGEALASATVLVQATSVGLGDDRAGSSRPTPLPPG